MDPFIGEIRPFPFTFAPQGWLYCDGSLVSINNYQTLYSLIGVTYGGDGQNTFGLPDLRSRVATHPTSATAVGQMGGQETVGLNSSQVAIHTHALQAGGTAAGTNPSNSIPAVDTVQVYGAATGTLGPNATSPNQGTGAPHANIQPYLTIAYCIAVEGIYPSPN